jgi:hypothetical protein
LTDLDWELLDQLSWIGFHGWRKSLSNYVLMIFDGSDYNFWRNFRLGIRARYEEIEPKFSRLFLSAKDYLDFKFQIVI